MKTKKIKSLCWGITNPIRATVGENDVINIVKKGEYPQHVEYNVYEKGRKSPRIIDGLRVDKVEYYE